MSTALIGMEILPNVYIDDICLYENRVTFSTFIIDSTADPQWSENLISKNKMKINIICSFNEENTAIFEGAYNMNSKMRPNDNFIIKKSGISRTRVKNYTTTSNRRSLMGHTVFKDTHEIKINKEVKLKKNKSMLQICKGYNNRLGKKSSIKYLPIDLVEEMFRLSL